MPYDKKKKFIVDTLFYSIIIALVIFVIKYALGYVMPFIVAFLVSAIIAPVAEKISVRFKTSPKFTACFFAFIFYCIAAGLIILACFGMYKASEKLFYNLPFIYHNSIEPAIASFAMSAQRFISDINLPLNDTVQNVAMSFTDNLGQTISDISVAAIGRFSACISVIPHFAASVFITIIATFFIVADYSSIRKFTARQIPAKRYAIICNICRCSFKIFGKYLKCYIIIMTMTFCELSMALWILNVKNFAVIAFLTAVFDIIPVCGSGGILIPWGIFSIVQGRFYFGISILIVYIIITVIRQIAEPQIIGNQVGIPPIATLMAMFVGLKLAGIAGLLIFPFLLVVLKNLNDNGHIRLFK